MKFSSRSYNGSMVSNRLFLNIRYFSASNRYFNAKIHDTPNVYNFYSSNYYRYSFSSSSPIFGLLLAGRIIQAAGLAINLPLTQNVIFTIFPPNKRGAAMGVMGLVMLAGPALGPTVAGLILDTLSWHWIFWVTVPFLLFSIIFGFIYLPNVNEVRKVSIDAISVILSTIGFGGIVYGLSVSGVNGWTSATVIGTIIVGL